jgi:hypothetical protein
MKKIFSVSEIQNLCNIRKYSNTNIQFRTYIFRLLDLQYEATTIFLTACNYLPSNIV